MCHIRPKSVQLVEEKSAVEKIVKLASYSLECTPKGDGR